jgi:hypothetical protein
MNWVIETLRPYPEIDNLFPMAPGFLLGGALSRRVIGFAPRKYELLRGATMLLTVDKSFIQLQPNSL